MPWFPQNHSISVNLIPEREKKDMGHNFFNHTILLHLPQILQCMFESLSLDWAARKQFPNHGKLEIINFLIPTIAFSFLEIEKEFHWQTISSILPKEIQTKH